jgi:hypothetical protein
MWTCLLPPSVGLGATGRLCQAWAGLEAMRACRERSGETVLPGQQSRTSLSGGDSSSQ